MQLKLLEMIEILTFYLLILISNLFLVVYIAQKEKKKNSLRYSFLTNLPLVYIRYRPGCFDIFT